MGGSKVVPSGRNPVRNALRMSASFHSPSPVSMSGVRLLAYVTPHGPCQPSSLPESWRSKSGAPNSAGVWQSLHAITVVRYLPRATFLASAAALALPSKVAPVSAAAEIASAATVRHVVVL